jgi:hypothetical protein
MGVHEVLEAKYLERHRIRHAKRVFPNANFAEPARPAKKVRQGTADSHNEEGVASGTAAAQGGSMNSHPPASWNVAS